MNSHLLKVLVREVLGETWVNLVPEEKSHRVSWNIRCTVFTTEKKAKYVSHSIGVKEPKLCSWMGQVHLYSYTDGDI